MVRNVGKRGHLPQGVAHLNGTITRHAPLVTGGATVKDKKTLVATFNSDCLQLADCVVVDVQCDYAKQSLGDMKTGEADMAALEATMRTIGEKIPAKCLTLIETTVAPGTTEFVAWPIMKKAFAARGIRSEPLLAHSFERVMPGREYVASIRDFWLLARACLLSTLLVLALILFMSGFRNYSRAIFILDGVLTFLLIGGKLIAIRSYFTGFANLKIREEFFPKVGYKKILIIGAGDAGEKILREIFENNQLHYKVIGFVDDDPKKMGRST
jgi:hypothetical protein